MKQMTLLRSAVGKAVTQALHEEVTRTLDLLQMGLLNRGFKLDNMSDTSDSRYLSREDVGKVRISDHDPNQPAAQGTTQILVGSPEKFTLADHVVNATPDNSEITMILDALGGPDTTPQVT